MLAPTTTAFNSGCTVGVGASTTRFKPANRPRARCIGTIHRQLTLSTARRTYFLAEIYFYFILNIFFRIPEKNFGERTMTIFIIPSLKNKQYSDNAHERRFNYHHKHRRQKDRQKHACPEAHGAECHRFYCFITFIQTFTHFVPF